MKNIIPTTVLVCVAALSACASNAPYQTSTPYNNNYAQQASFGTVESIQWVGNERPSSGAGAVVGGILGAIVGNQIGGGTGRTVATVAGGIGGAVIGNNVEKNRQINYYQINIRMDGGGYQVVHQADIGNLRNGDRIRVADGHAYRY
nr:glycine zipper 2TM domain-containing protein [uncultured Undibacterium sp.]